MKKPPCKINGIDCPDRYIGCKAECEKWHDWLSIHEAEKEAQKKHMHNPADDFLIRQQLKLKKASNKAKLRGHKL